MKRFWLNYLTTHLLIYKGKPWCRGILDVHGHFPGEGLSAVAADLNSPPVGNLITIHNVLDRLAEEAITTKEGGW
jgi:hypothetical protein